MSLDTMKVFQDQTYTTALELLAQQIQLFNAATKGGLVLRSAANQGDYTESTLYQRISGLIRRRSPYVTGAVSEKELTMLLDRSVKVGSGTPPVRMDKAWWRWMQRNPAEAGVVLGRQMGEEMLADMVNTAIKALVAAMANVGATVVFDGTAATLSLGAMNNGAALFGDRAQAILCWLLHSTPYHNLIGAAITNSNSLFSFGTINVVSDGLGRPLVVSDAPDLLYTSSGQKYRTLGLSQGAAVVEQNDDYDDNIENGNGDENITRTFQAEWSYNLGIKGFAWDVDNGGKAPSNSALGTGTNWDKYATNIKDTAGVMVNSQ